MAKSSAIIEKRTKFDPERAAPTLRQRLAGLARVAGLSAIIVAVALFWAGHRVHAYGERMLENMGQHMMQYAGARQQNAPERLSINGATFFISTGNVDGSVKAVLDRFHAKCNERNGRLREQWASLAAQHKIPLEDYSSLFDGVFRSGGSEQGVIACAETGDERLGPDALTKRVQRVLATGDLAQLGGLRYVYVMQGSNAKSAAFVALWSEGHLNYREMFPKTADAPGADPTGVPRAAWTQRVISSFPQSGEASLNVYVSKTLSRSDLLAFYRNQLPEAGFKVTQDKNETGESALVAQAGGRTLLVSVRDDERSGKGMASLVVQGD